MTEAEQRKPEKIPTALLALKAPVEWFERLDRWRLQHPQQPSRPRTIRWIVHEFLLKEEAKAARPKRATAARRKK